MLLCKCSKIEYGRLTPNVKLIFIEFANNVVFLFNNFMIRLLSFSKVKFVESNKL